MSESRPGATRYQRTSGGLVGAMIVTVLFVVAFVGLRGFVRDNESTPVRKVDYQTWVKAGRSDGKLAVYVPSPLPTAGGPPVRRTRPGRSRPGTSAC